MFLSPPWGNLTNFITVRKQMSLGKHEYLVGVCCDKGTKRVICTETRQAYFNKQK